MYKKISFVFMLVLGLNVSAQTTYDPTADIQRVAASLDMTKMSFGIKLSPTISWLEVQNNDMQAEGAALKFGIGGVANYELLPNLLLVSGVNYNGFGGYVRDNNSLNDTVFKSYYKVNYGELEVPLALKIKTTPVNKTSFFLQGGFSAGFIINASEKRSPQVSGTKDKLTDISLMTNPTRINCLVGAGVDYLIGAKTTLFGLISYKNTLTNVANTTAYQVSRYTDPVQINPGSMEFSIGIMF